MYRHLLLLSLVSVLGLTCLHSQSDKVIRDARVMQLNFKENKSDIRDKIPFSELIVMDLRFDTTKLGYFTHRHKLTLDTNSSVAMAAILNKQYADNLLQGAEQKLLLVIRTLWLQQDRFEYLNTKNVVAIEYRGSYEKAGICFTEIDAFTVSNNECRPLLRLEEDFFNESYKPGKIEKLFFMPFDSLIHKLQSIDIAAATAGKKKLRYAEVADNYLKRFNIPVLQQPVLNRGVFLTFDDFKNNRISYPDFTFTKDDLTGQLRTSNSNGMLLTDYWGFCDDKKLFIRCGFTYYELIRQNNTFDLFGSKFITERFMNFGNNSTINGSGGPITVMRTKTVKKPLQLDMQTGQLY